MATNCDVTTTQINGNDCIGDSLDTFNDNFDTLNAKACDIATEASKRLRIENKGIILDDDTFVLNFSGGQVNTFIEPIYEDPDGPYTRKTVFCPLTGVYSLTATDTVVDNTILFPKIELVSWSGPFQGEGNVVMRLRVPDPPKQVRTFFYHGAKSNTKPTDGMDDGVNSYPSVSRVSSFINDTNQLNLTNAVYAPKPGDEVFVFYQKTAHSTKLVGAVDVPGHQHGLNKSIVLPSHTHTVNNSVAGGGHSHTLPGTGQHADHSHSFSPRTSSGGNFGGGHSSGGSTETVADHTHTIPSTNAAGNSTVTYNTTTVASTPFRVPAAAIDMYIHTTIIYRFILSIVNNTPTYQIAPNYPKFVQAKSSDSSNWKSIQNWTADIQTYGATS